MKKTPFLMALAIAGGMASCAQGPKANMKPKWTPSHT